MFFFLHFLISELKHLEWMYHLFTFKLCFMLREAYFLNATTEPKLTIDMQ